MGKYYLETADSPLAWFNRGYYELPDRAIHSVY